MEKYMLGIDIGTTNVKAALYTFSGEEILVESTSYKLYTDEVGAAIQDAHEIREGVFWVIRKVTTACQKRGIEVSFISFSSAMHSLLAVDKKGEAMTPVLTWGDRRAEPYTALLDNEKGSALYHRTGTPIHPMSPFVKLLWIQEEYPHIIEKANRLIGIKTYILYQLFGEYYTDYSVANATGLFNMKTLAWDEEALEMAGVSEGILPQIVPTTKVFPGINEKIAAALGLSPQTKVVIGASDGCLSNLGVNAMQPGTVALTIGTSGAIRSVTNQPVTDIAERTFCYALTEDYWVVGGPVNNGGVVLDWARSRFAPETLFEKNGYTHIMQQIDGINPGADDLFFHPYLVGERAPIWRADVKGSFFGLSLHHQNEHMMRAVLEGINFNLFAVYQAISEVIGDQAKEILVTGGFTKSEVWVQMLADIFGTEIAVTNVTENACFGAGLLGLLALGEIQDFSNIGEMTAIHKRYLPDQKRHVFYQNHFEKYLKINQHFLAIYDEMQ